MNGNKFWAIILPLAICATACTKNEIVEPASDAIVFEGIIDGLNTRTILSAYDDTTDPENPVFEQIWIGSETPYIYRLNAANANGTKGYMKASDTYLNQKRGYRTLSFTPQGIGTLTIGDKLFSLHCSSGSTNGSNGPTVTYTEGTGYSLSGTLAQEQHYYANTTLDDEYEQYYDRNIVNSSQMHKIAWIEYGTGDNKLKFHNLFSIVRIPLVFVADTENARCGIKTVKLSMKGCVGTYKITIPGFSAAGVYNLTYTNLKDVITSTVQENTFKNGGSMNSKKVIKLDAEPTNFCFDVLPQVYVGDTKTGGMSLTYEYVYLDENGVATEGSKTVSVHKTLDLTGSAVYTFNPVTIDGATLHK